MAEMAGIPRHVILAQSKRHRDVLAARVNGVKEAISILVAGGQKAKELDPEGAALQTPIGVMVNALIGSHLASLHQSLEEGQKELAALSERIAQEERMVNPAGVMPNLAKGPRRQ